jgi:RNA methyltransferase, TrmH family
VPRPRQALRERFSSTITTQDAEVHRFRELGQPGGRQRHGQFVVEGLTLTGRAIGDGLPVDCVIHTAELSRASGGASLLELARREDIRCLRASSGLMGTLTPTRPLPAVIAAVGLRLRDVAELETGPDAVLLVAENLQNPDNLGMVLRTADAAGVGAVVVAGDAGDPLQKNCVRAARGAVGRIPIFTCADLPPWLMDLRRGGFQVIGATAQGEVSLFDRRLQAPIAIVVGNEDHGVSRPVLDVCTERVRIPMAPGQDSLNVGVAAGVLLYQVRRASLGNP